MISAKPHDDSNWFKHKLSSLDALIWILAQNRDVNLDGQKVSFGYYDSIISSILLGLSNKLQLDDLYLMLSYKPWSTNDNRWIHLLTKPKSNKQHYGLIHG